jgi:peptide/nickel transport system permease protein
MIRFVLARLANALFVAFGVGTAVFFLVRLVPGDPVEAMLGEAARPADRAALYQALGLARPLMVQFLDYWWGVVTLDLGLSLRSQRPVVALLAERLPATLELAVLSLALAVAVALPLGVVAAVRRGTRADRGAMALALLGMAIPNFVLGPVLILVFSVWLGWLPVSGREEALSLVLPAVTLGTALAAVLSRMVRSTLLETLTEDYIRTARAKGLAEPVVILRHGLRNALLPILTLLGLQLGALLGGAVITETVFSWPGIGLLTIEAIQARDYQLVQGCVLLISLVYVAVNTLTDLLYGWVDPRVSLTGRGP